MTSSDIRGCRSLPTLGALRWGLLTLGLLIGQGLTPAASTPIHPVDGGEAPVLERLGSLEGMTAFSLGPAGLTAAIASRDPGDDRRSVVRLVGDPGTPTKNVSLRGNVRDLLHTADGTTVYAMVHRAAKRNAGNTELFAVNVVEARARRMLRLPTSARALAMWPATGRLAVASSDDVRTFGLPALRSGPLYRIPGDNLSLAFVGNRALLGRVGELVLVDLDTPPERDGIPASDRLAVPGAAVSIRATPGSGHAFARLADGSVYRVDLDPLRISARGRAAALALAPAPTGPTVSRQEIAGPASKRTASTAPDPTVETPPRRPDRPAAPRRPDPRSEDEELPGSVDAKIPAEGRPIVGATADSVRTAPPPSSAPEVPDERPTATAPSTKPSASPPRSPDVSAVAPALSPPSPAARPPEPPPRADARQTGSSLPSVSGRILGEPRSSIAGIVLLGPNNVLKEFARVKPDADGSWRMERLPPGRYRVQLDAGGSRAVLSDPSWAMIDVTGTEAVTAPDFVVLRVF